MPSLSALVCFLCSATLSAASLAQAPPPSSSQEGTCDAACQDAKKAAAAANAAAAAAKNAADNANSAAGTAKTAVDTANSASRNANVAADSANDAGTQAKQSAKDAADAAANATSAIDAAKKAAADAAKKTAQYRLVINRGKAKNPTIDDYVPCLFDSSELFANRGLPGPPPDPEGTPLTPTAAKATVGTVREGLASQDSPQVKLFADTLNPNAFVGLRPNEIPARLNELGSKFAATLKVPPEQQAAAAASVQKATDAAGPAAQKSAVDNNAVAATFNRPADVSCSFSVLQWHETSDTFGRRVANDYIGLEVNVRNLSPTNEFLIHDIQIAVDTGLNPAQFGRFQAARDKLVVRNVAQKGQSEDARNRIINLLLLLGAVAGPASGALTQGNPNSDAAGNVATGVSIFQGPFVAGLTAMFPDHTLEHINHISDLTFSASSTSKTVVPIQGSVPLITFLAEKPLEQLPFAYCGVNGQGKFIAHNSKNPDAPGSSQYNYCNLAEQAAATDQPDYYMKPLHFHHWRPAAIEILERRVFVVIAGVHIQELTSSPRVDRVSCPPGNDENVDLTKADSSGAVTCTLHGNYLTKASAIKLEQQGAKTISGTLSATDDQTATITFKTADAAGANGKYELFLTDTSGTDVDAKQVLNFGNPTTITKISCQPGTDANLDLSKADSSTAISCTLTGTNLDKASYFKLDQPKAQTIWPTTKASADGNSTTLTFTLDDNLKKATGSYELWFTDATGKTVDSGQKITLPSPPTA